MRFSKTTAFKKIANLTKRIRIIQGGTSASKTVSVLIYLIAKAQHDLSPTLTSVVSESIPHLKRGAMRDFLMIMKEQDYFEDSRWNMSNFTYTFETGSTIEFFSVDQPDKLRGARRDRLFINEANNVYFEAFEQLEVRTKEFIILDFNPTNEFWVFTEIIPKRSDYEKIILTYKDNEALPKEIVDSIEARRNRPSWFKVYGEGELGVVEGRIYKDWEIIDSIPHEARLEVRGLDFGYSVDPTAIIDVYKYNGGYILDEILYKKGMSNKQLADTINNQIKSQVLTIADSSEPKSIDEIKLYDVNILPAVKGPGSIATGISFVQSQQISVTKRSINLIKEFRNYLWEIDDKTNRILPIPDKRCEDHALDAVRYALNSVLKPSEYTNKLSVSYSDVVY